MEDELEDEEPPRVRPVRMVVASVLGVGSALGVVWAIFALRAPQPEPSGEVATMFQPLLSSASALIALVVFSVIALVSVITLVRALLEAREARPDESG